MTTPTAWWTPTRGDQLSQADRDGIWDLMSRHAAKDRAQFEATLATCDLLFLVRRPGRIAGLAGFSSSEDHLDGRPVSILYVHWWVLDRDVRGAHITSLMSIRAIFELRRRHPLRPVIGLGKCTTAYSYALTVRTCPWSYPSPRRVFPPALEAMTDRAMRRIAGDAWDPEQGVYRGTGTFEYRDGYRDPDAPDPAFRFYAARNPGQANGDGLVLAVPLDLANFVGIFANLLRRSLRWTTAAPASATSSNARSSTS